MKLISYLLAMLCFSNSICAQEVPNIDARIILDVSELNSIYNDNGYHSSKFNFHEYEEINLSEFGKSFELEDVEKYSLFVVFTHSDVRDLFFINNNERQVRITENEVVGKQNLPIEIDKDVSHILLYSGSSGKKIEEELSTQMKLGGGEQAERKGTINLAEVLVFDKVLSRPELNYYRSSLAIKYGISLPKDSSYVDRGQVKIYDGIKHVPFNHRVMALAHSEKLRVNQTTNHRDSFMSIAIDKIYPIQKFNSAQLEEDSYLFIGDDSGSLQFNSYQLDRKWKFINSNLENTEKSFDLKFAVDRIENFEDHYNYYLVLSPSVDFDKTFIKKYKLNKVGKYLLSNETRLLTEEVQYVTIHREPKEVLKNKDVSMQVNNLQLIDREVQVSLNSDIHMKGNMLLYSAEGFLIDNQEVEALQHYEMSYRLDRPGIYFLIYRSGETTLVEKIVIQ